MSNMGYNSEIDRDTIPTKLSIQRVALEIREAAATSKLSL